MKTWRYTLYFFASEFFQYSLFTYFLLFIIETLQKGFVSNFFNLNILLAIVLTSGSILIVTYTEKIKKYTAHKKYSSADIQNLFALTLVAGMFVYYRTHTLGKVSFILAGITIILIILISILLLVQKEK